MRLQYPGIAEYRVLHSRDLVDLDILGRDLRAEVSRGHRDRTLWEIQEQVHLERDHLRQGIVILERHGLYCIFEHCILCTRHSVLTHFVHLDHF